MSNIQAAPALRCRQTVQCSWALEYVCVGESGHPDKQEINNNIGDKDRIKTRLIVFNNTRSDVTRPKLLHGRGGLIPLKRLQPPEGLYVYTRERLSISRPRISSGEWVVLRDQGDRVYELPILHWDGEGRMREGRK